MGKADDVLEALLSGGYEGGEDSGPSYIGVPEGFQGGSIPNDAHATMPGFVGPPTATQVQRATGAPVWTEGSENVLFGKSPEDVWRIQRSLMGAGLLEGKFRKGLVDDKTVSAYRSLLGWANRLGTGRDLNATLNALASSPELVDGSQGADDAYLPPDYATLKQQIKGVFRNQLRRDPTPSELTMLADELRGGYDAAADVARQQPATIGNDADATPEGFVGPPTAEQVYAANDGLASSQPQASRVDPEARFMEAFESRYANELGTLEGEDEAGRTQQVVSSGSNLLARMIGG